MVFFFCLCAISIRWQLVKSGRHPFIYILFLFLCVEMLFFILLNLPIALNNFGRWCFFSIDLHLQVFFFWHQSPACLAIDYCLIKNFHFFFFYLASFFFVRLAAIRFVKWDTRRYPSAVHDAKCYRLYQNCKIETSALLPYRKLMTNSQTNSKSFFPPFFSQTKSSVFWFDLQCVRFNLFDIGMHTSRLTRKLN